MKLRKLSNFVCRIIKISIIFGIFMPAVMVRAQIDSLTSVVVTYVTISGASLDELLVGNTGEGLLLYSLFENQDLRLAVRLSKPSGANSTAYAEIYEIPITLQNLELSSSINRELNRLNPKIVLRSLSGAWVTNDNGNFNLDISIYGPTYAMWGAGYDPDYGYFGSAGEIAPDELAVEIQVRDTNQDGLPDWELRQLIPEFLGYGYLRVNYTERKCVTPTVIDQGIFPAWPYIASSGGFEQGQGVFRPPVVVDWASGKITHFSELVTARNQNCSYTIYSISNLEEDRVNELDFETPFSFYDLSGEGVGYPNLIMRTERYPENSPWISVSKEPFEYIRYSWRNDIGDWFWDYKIEVLGFHTYDSQTPIAAGQYLIDAPGYEEYPRWVMDKSWPLVTFIDTEESSYRSSEGIYDWSPRAFSTTYFLGGVETPDLTGFQSIQQGLRGEYRIGDALPVVLYFSPIDNRLHLQNAQAGLYNLGGEQQLRLYNLVGDMTLDGWTRERVPSEEDGASEIIEGLFILGNRAFYFGNRQVIFYSLDIPDSMFTVSPPVDQATWDNFRHVMAVQAVRKSPLDLSGWMDNIGTQVITFVEATTSLPRYASGVYRFEMVLENGFQLFGGDNSELSDLAPGRYLITYDQVSFQVDPLTPTQLSLLLNAYRSDIHTGENGFRVSLQAVNSGKQDSDRLECVLRVVCGENPLELLREIVFVPGEGQIDWTMVWQQPPNRNCRLTASLNNLSGEQITTAILDIPSSPRSNNIILQVYNSSTQNHLTISAFGLLGLLGSLTGLLFWLLWRSNSTSNGKRL